MHCIAGFVLYQESNWQGACCGGSISRYPLEILVDCKTTYFQESLVDSVYSAIIIIIITRILAIKVLVTIRVSINSQNLSNIRNAVAIRVLWISQ